MPGTRTLRGLVALAIRAPSSHNTQPWRFELAEGIIRLFADRSRALPVNDPDDRELTISCGCALFTLRAASAAWGLGTQVRILPDGHAGGALAELRFDGPPEPRLAALAEAILRRRTHRRRFDAQEVPRAMLARLEEAASSEGAELRAICEPAARTETARLVAEGDALQWADPAWRRELAEWMTPRRSGDGLTLPALAAPVARQIVRRFDMGGGVAARDQELAEHSPLIAILGTRGDGARDWLGAGQALQRVLLVAASAGLQASYLNQPVEQPTLRPRLARVALTDAQPQILMRLGYTGETAEPSPRRPVEAVILP